MPVLVVDQLESVEIQKHHRKALAVATRLRHRQVKAVVQQYAVRQVCEPVVVRAKIERPLRFPALRNIPSGGIGSGEAAVGRAVEMRHLDLRPDRGRLRGSRPGSARMQAQPEFGIVDAVGVFLKQVSRQLQVVFQHDTRVVLAEQRILAVAKQALHRIVDEEESAIGAKQEHQVGGTVEHDLVQHSGMAAPVGIIRVPRRFAGGEKVAYSVGSVFAYV